MDFQQNAYQPELLPIPPNLKPKEIQVLSMLARGYGVSHMASELGYSANYIYLLMRELRMQFYVSTNTALISRAIGIGILAPDGTVRNSSSTQAKSA